MNSVYYQQSCLSCPFPAPGLRKPVLWGAWALGVRIRTGRQKGEAAAGAYQVLPLVEGLDSKEIPHLETLKQTVSIPAQKKASCS